MPVCLRSMFVSTRAETIYLLPVSLSVNKVTRPKVHFESAFVSTDQFACTLFIISSPLDSNRVLSNKTHTAFEPAGSLFIQLGLDGSFLHFFLFCMKQKHQFTTEVDDC